MLRSGGQVLGVGLNCPKSVASVQRLRTALGSKAAICSAKGHVRLVPIGDIAPQQMVALFDHLVGARHRQGDAQRLGGLEVDQAKLVDEDINHPNRIILLEPCRVNWFTRHQSR